DVDRIMINRLCCVYYYVDPFCGDIARPALKVIAAIAKQTVFGLADRQRGCDYSPDEEANAAHHKRMVLYRLREACSGLSKGLAELLAGVCCSLRTGLIGPR